MNDLVQLAIVTITVIVAGVLLWRSLRHKNDCHSGCDDCPLNDNCRRKK